MDEVTPRADDRGIAASADPAAEPDEHVFDADTAVDVAADGSIRGELTDRWDRLVGGPLGGYTLALAVRALAARMPKPDPLVLSAYFLRRAVHGVVHGETHVVRDGRQVATGTCVLLQNGQPLLHVTASFGDLAAASGRTTMLASAPDLPPPDQCVNPLDELQFPGVTIVERVETRFEGTPGWLAGRPSGDPSAEFWMRLTPERRNDLAAIPLLVDAGAPVVVELGETGSSTIELTLHLRSRPAPGWLACRASTRHVLDGLHEEDFEIWDSTGRLVAQSRQLAMLPRQ